MDVSHCEGIVMTAEGHGQDRGVRGTQAAWPGDWTEVWGDRDDAGLAFYPRFFGWMDTAFHRRLLAAGSNIAK